MRRRILLSVLAVAGFLPLAATHAAAAATSKATETSQCLRVVTNHVKVSKSTISACRGSSLKVSYLCPKGSSTIFVVSHQRTYALHVGRKPVRLAKQYGMGAITQACGFSTAVPHSPPTTTTAAPPPPTTTTAAPPPPTTTTTTTTVPPPPPTTAAAASCSPMTDAGNCYEPGEYCRATDHGVSGTAGNGEAITCENHNGWRWEPS